MNNQIRWAVVWLAFLFILTPACPAQDASKSTGNFAKGMVLNHIGPNGATGETAPIPKDAVSIYTYEGEPKGVRIDGETILVSYQWSGVAFNARTGKAIRRYTIADGWPDQLADYFKPTTPLWKKRDLIGPGVAGTSYKARNQNAREALINDVSRFTANRASNSTDKSIETAVICSVAYNGQTFCACQPVDFLNNFERNVKWEERRKNEQGAWTRLLSQLNREWYVEIQTATGTVERRFTMADGLASNIVTHLAVANNTLWAACVDIYDSTKGDWRPGGLCKYDAKSQRWERVIKINNQPVRWVTLLKTTDEGLWVGFLEGEGVVGDEVIYGMGLYAGTYRPRATALILARFSGGKWTEYLREPLPYYPQRGGNQPAEAQPSTEAIRGVARFGTGYLVYTTTTGRGWGNWESDRLGHVWFLDPGKTGPEAWKEYQVGKDIKANEVKSLVVDKETAVLSSNLGAHRWNVETQSWEYLDPQCVLKNPVISSYARVGDESWFGYSNQAFGVIGTQGISRYNEKTDQWGYFTPEEIGTACPVRYMATTSKSDVWALFQERPWYGAAGEFPLYGPPDKPITSGVGHYSNSKWQFPATLAGVPESVTVEVKDRQGTVKTHNRPLPISDMVLLNDVLYVANEQGVFAGPETFRKITEGAIVNIQPATDGIRLMIHRYPLDYITKYPNGFHGMDMSRIQRGIFDPSSQTVQYDEPVQNSWEVPWRMQDNPGLSTYTRQNEYPNFSGLPGIGDGSWALSIGLHAEIPSGDSLWLVSHGFLVRMIPEKINAFLKNNAPAPQ